MLPVLAVSVICVVTWTAALNDPSSGKLEQSSNSAGSLDLIAQNDLPRFGKPLNNLTVSVGREAIFTCTVENLGMYKVAWLRVDTQTILTIATHVITKNHRISVTHAHRTWSLHIKDTKVRDRGWYMCQVNTDPMSSNTGFLEVVVASFQGPELEITRVTRLHMGSYLCIASNGVPPSVSKRIVLIVQFQPMIWIEDQLVGAYVGEKLTLECRSEAFPRPITYWTGPSNETIASDMHYLVEAIPNGYEITMRLTIKSVRPEDIGYFRCVATNSLGETDGKIQLYKNDRPATTRRPSTRRDSKKAWKIDHSHERKTAGMKDEPMLKNLDGDDEQIDFQSATASSLFHRHLFANLGITAVTAILAGLST
ncbi:protein amalgam isoform X3 [Nomia melanderi]|uniref:protein amalgam isoform X3 n=1 Tax=Nomia melanderi TaxID=2448451 RepID=UPI0013046302|nr:protein amalgam-like isoform X3 [Nomia melanderi]